MDGQQGQPPTYLNYRGGSTSNGSSPYNGNIAQPPVSPARPPPAPPPPAMVPTLPKTLLVFVSDAPAPDMQVYLSTILSRYTLSEVTIVATNDDALKLTRMDVYTAAGKARQDILVSTARINAPLASSELTRALHGLEDKTLCGVLCCQHGNTPPAETTTPRDLLDYSEAELEESWRVSYGRSITIDARVVARMHVGDNRRKVLTRYCHPQTNFMTLHTLARATVPLLRRAPLSPSPFFCLDSTTRLSPLDNVAQEALVQQLAASPASQGLRFGTAREELIPVVIKPLSIDIPSSNASHRDTYYGGQQEDNYTPSPLSGSPTKLWASWALMNE